jgi:hypothetical protein
MVSRCAVLVANRVLARKPRFRPFARIAFRGNHRILAECAIMQARTLRRIFGNSTPGGPVQRADLLYYPHQSRGAVEIQEGHDENREIAELVLGVIRSSSLISGSPWNGEWRSAGEANLRQRYRSYFSREMPGLPPEGLDGADVAGHV